MTWINWKWEGAELCLYYNNKSYSISLTNAQFAVIIKILGIELKPDGSITCFSDETLEKIAKIKNNPLHLQQKEKGE